MSEVGKVRMFHFAVCVVFVLVVVKLCSKTELIQRQLAANEELLLLYVSIVSATNCLTAVCCRAARAGVGWQDGGPRAAG